MPITLNGVYDLAMVLDTGSPVSGISPAMVDELHTLGLLARPGESRYHHRLTNATTADGHPLPDFDVVVLPRLARMKAVGVDVPGILGLNFLNEFEHICYYVDARSLVLRPRARAATMP